jgi:hypothetical protein
MRAGYDDAFPSLTLPMKRGIVPLREAVIFVQCPFHRLVAAFFFSQIKTDCEMFNQRAFWRAP